MNDYSVTISLSTRKCLKGRNKLSLYLFLLLPSFCLVLFTSNPFRMFCFWWSSLLRITVWHCPNISTSNYSRGLCCPVVMLFFRKLLSSKNRTTNGSIRKSSSISLGSPLKLTIEVQEVGRRCKQPTSNINRLAMIILFSRAMCVQNAPFLFNKPRPFCAFDPKVGGWADLKVVYVGV